MNKNINLNNAKKDKNDEFYTQLVDIENEVKFYFDKFKNKSVFCNCDDPELYSVLKDKLLIERFKDKNERIEFYNNYKDKKIIDDAASQFWVYFHKQFKHLGLKELVATHYREGQKPSFAMRYTGQGSDDNIYDFDLIEFETSDGDFRSPECIELLKKSDIVVTNPPFSLFREYVQQLLEYQNQFLIIGHQNAIKYKEIFPLIKNEKIWLGNGFKGGAGFFKSSKYKDYAKASSHKEGFIRVSGVNWFTNLDFKKRHESHILVEKYDPIKNKKYDSYDAINVDKTSDIPEDYFDKMGVPITFLTKFNPKQFEIIDLNNAPSINGVKKYSRMIIKRKI